MHRPGDLQRGQLGSTATRRCTPPRSGSELGIPDDRIVVGVVATLQDKKGHHVLLDAFARTPGLERVWLMLVGDGPSAPSLEEHAATLGIRDRVTFCGTRRDLGNLLPAMDIFALPSLWEGLPLALILAMGAGAAGRRDATSPAFPKSSWTARPVCSSHPATPRRSARRSLACARIPPSGAAWATLPVTPCAIALAPTRTRVGDRSLRGAHRPGRCADTRPGRRWHDDDDSDRRLQPVGWRQDAGAARQRDGRSRMARPHRGSRLRRPSRRSRSTPPSSSARINTSGWPRPLRMGAFYLALALTVARDTDVCLANFYLTAYCAWLSGLLHRRARAIYFLQGDEAESHGRLADGAHSSAAGCATRSRAAAIVLPLPMLCVSHWLRRQVARPDADVVGQGIDLGVFRPRPREAARVRVVVGTIGGDARVKGYPDVVTAAVADAGTRWSCWSSPPSTSRFLPASKGAA